MPDTATPNSRAKRHRIAISAIVTFMVGGTIVSAIHHVGLGLFSYLLFAFVCGMAVSLLFPEIWFAGPLLAGAIDLMAFIHAVTTQEMNMWPVAAAFRLVWFVMAYIGAAMGILISRRFWRT
jgi:hypothetical protein